VPYERKDHVLVRVEALRNMNRETQPDKWRIRAITNGGVDGIYAIMAWDMGKGSSGMNRQGIANAYGVDLPVVNLIASGIERLGQQVGVEPTLKPVYSEDDKIRDDHMKRVEMVHFWDEEQNIILDYPQAGRWLPGYSFVMWKLAIRNDSFGQPYPCVELCDPFDVWPGWFGPRQSPQEAARVRVVPLGNLKTSYPDAPWNLYDQKIKDARRTPLGGIGRTGGNRTRSWEGPQTGVEVIEYFDEYGTYVCVPEVEDVLGYVPNMVSSGPPFVFAKRFSFDKLISQYHHVIGVSAMMAKLNILALVGVEDSTFRETNVFGDLESGDYERGRFAYNLLASNARVEKPVGEIANQAWAQIDRLEKQMRIGANYDVQQDGISPNSFVTGAGGAQLRASADSNIREYHLIMRQAAQRIDSIRLEAMETVFPSRRFKVFDMKGGETWYRPSKDIKGQYRTRRVYGAMATFDDQAKMIVGVGLINADVMDVETLQENIAGFENLPLMNRRINEKKAVDVLYQRLQMRADQDPRADAALVEIAEDGSKMVEILKKYFTPQEPELSPEEQAMMAQLQGGQGGAPPGLPQEPIQTVLSRIETGGAPEAGLQTVGRT
jgi:hypothetical protein